MRISNELRVGIMFFVGLTLLILLILTMTRWGQDRNAYTFSIRFNEASGIQNGADVRVSGVKVGQVSDISIDPATNQAIVTVRVDKRVALSTGYSYTIGIGGLVGERFIDIRPTKLDGKRIQPGDQITGTTTADINDLIDSSNKVVSKLSETVDAINKVVADKENQQNLKLAAADLRKTMDSSAQLARTLNAMVQRNQGSVDVIVADLRGVAGDIRRVSDQITPQLVRSKFFVNLEHASENAESITARLDNITKVAESVLTDKTTATCLREALANLRQASVDLQKTMSNVQLASVPLPQVTANLQKASADLPQITGPLKEIAPETAANILQISRNFRKTSETINNSAQQLANLEETVSSIKIEPEARILYMGNNDQNVRSDLNVDFILKSNMFRLGVTNIGTGNQVNAQLGNQLNPEFWLRYGLVQSQLGAGLDYQPSEKWRFSGDLFDPNNIQANLTAYYQLPIFDGKLWLTAGGYNLFTTNNWGAGLTYRH